MPNSCQKLFASSNSLGIWVFTEDRLALNMRCTGISTWPRSAFEVVAAQSYTLPEGAAFSTNWLQRSVHVIGFL